jgi:hypothetical protein
MVAGDHVNERVIEKQRLVLPSSTLTTTTWISSVFVVYFALVSDYHLSFSLAKKMI